MNRRRDELLEMLLDRGRLRVGELTAHFGVSGKRSSCIAKRMRRSPGLWCRECLMV